MCEINVSYIHTLFRPVCEVTDIFCPILTKLDFFPQIFVTVPNIKSQIICPVRAALLRVWTDRRAAIFMMYLLTAIGLSPIGRSTVHIYTQTIHRTVQNKQYIEQHNNFGRVRAVPRLG